MGSLDAWRGYKHNYQGMMERTAHVNLHICYFWKVLMDTSASEGSRWDRFCGSVSCTLTQSTYSLYCSQNLKDSTQFGGVLVHGQPLVCSELQKPQVLAHHILSRSGLPRVWKYHRRWGCCNGPDQTARFRRVQLARSASALIADLLRKLFGGFFFQRGVPGLDGLRH